MLPIPKGTQEEEKKGTRNLTCPYCDDNPFVSVLSSESVAVLNKHFDEGPDGRPHYRNDKHNYEKGLFCDKCKTTWLWENTPDGKGCWDTYVGKDVPRIREVVIIGGNAASNILPIKDWETGEYMPLLHPFAPLVKKPSK